MKHCIILGTRPEIIKLSSLIRELQKRSLDFFIVHTNQHYTKEMDEVFFQELELPKPKYNLEIGSGSHGEQSGKMIIKIEEILKKEHPNHVYVQGDTNSVIAGVMAAAKELSIRVSHIEAGLRSYDRTMPEEINRVIADHVSDYLFAPTEKEREILTREGIPGQRVFVVGNTIVDAVQQNIHLAVKKENILNRLGVKEKAYFLLTAHRPANVDSKEVFSQILKGVEEVSKLYSLKTIFPCHPRTKERLREFNMVPGGQIIMTDPLGYLEMLLIMQKSRMILTDSGGIQEEACILQVPCVTLRNNTERPDTLAVGGNILAGNSQENITKSVKEMYDRRISWYNPFGDGATAKHILDIIYSQPVSK